MTRVTGIAASISGVARSMAIVGSGSLIGQGVALLAAPILARIYEPDAFGLLGIYLAIIMIVNSVATLRFDSAIPISKGLAEATHLLTISIASATVAAVIVLASVALAGDALAEAIGAPALASHLWLVPFGLMMATVSQALSFYQAQARAYAGIARMRAVQGIGQAVFQIGLGLLQGGAFGLIAGDVIGRSLGVVVLLRSAMSRIRGLRTSAAAMLGSARAYWGFARIMTIASFIGVLSLQAPFLLIPLLFDLGSSGQYFMAHRILVLPAALVSAAVYQVFFSEASRHTNDPEALHALAKQAMGTLFVFAIPTYTLVFIAGPFIFSRVLGEQWIEAGEFARIISPWLLLWSVASPLSSLLLVGRRERESLMFTTIDLSVRTGALLLGAALGSLMLGIVALSLASIAASAAGLWRILRVAAVTPRDTLGPVIGTGIAVAPAMLALVVIFVLAGDSIGTIVGLALCVLAWLVALGVAAMRSPELKAFLRAVDA